MMRFKDHKQYRLKDYDYGSDGYYFVTICTKNREHYFGEIENGQMYLSDLGQIAKQFWENIPAYVTYAGLDEFVVMPDHLHGIIVIDNSHRRNGRSTVPTMGIINNNDSMQMIWHHDKFI